MKILKEALYTKDHEWIKVDGDRAYVGITDFAQDSLGDIVFVDLPEVDSEFEKAEVFGAVESVKAASDLYIPVSGRVLEINEELIDNPEYINQDPYKNWIISIEVMDNSQLGELLAAEDYEKLCGEE
ncbi:glycine cleavage system protein GcvH [Clostridium luticellarii]|jgi:glycine cleavage system H protein|uniref:Glycine cleavage system H protein n=1 Tax=Clostridium luticellarii TaxID=1691940 RepID=A0A2T0BN19_9CLOT|nr:glycine cleavage system protein GcvH [Clostridium luticellarii]MCI1945147.1 glycine cleavage system protein GcvH [Clostridium luticellarii]MCI1968536.1 glycine cleavage system protein GcvH [Clostridium luticellarii]MCI1995989.1 glycine cleavage system protein GcvH [Clostridium luticellarii]MCI2041235.1 glycine cleavage system protein GcvH [Clostridium luticellarii]PRR85275.1 Glycine cleavage system H protein [Clostridium luticellarii]